MWIVTINNTNIDEEVEVVAFNYDDLRAILMYVEESNDTLELEHVEYRWMVMGLDGLRDATDNSFPNKI